MQARHFTLEQARAVLPQVRAMMQEAQTARAEILQLRPDAWPALRAASTNGGNLAATELVVQFTKLEKNVKGIMRLGIHVKDIDHGLVDFLGTRNGRDILLCWRHGEDDIEFWHDLNAGFAGRRPIDAQVE